ncbi:cell envelope integrity protein CreD [Roseateles toxinivorans]|uniref:Inner membrane protein n=1 Tax=Roseateles toxinivorans TaxID=270368 RepID=A0A4R6QRC1_9BURK|nr:cell envelope integrity protein CreD [Roseateles toxinivorans]TDP72311.1 inner membrane protein [Roseateles toxinivorans]
MRFPVLTKALALIAVLLALMMALASVTGIVRERESRLREAQASVADGLAGAQTLLGPVLRRACDERWDVMQGEGKERQLVTERRDFVLTSLPATLDIKAKADIAPRYRGIFKVNTYTLGSSFSAQWADLSALRPRAEHAGGRLHCEPPQVFVAVGDARGIRVATVTANQQALAILPGTGHGKHGRGFHAQLPAEWVDNSAAPLKLSVGLDLVGTGTLAFAPLGEITQLELRSDWPHPSFGGRFLPSKREVTAKGFTANWQLSALATSAPQELLTGAGLCAFGDIGPETNKTACVETFGLSFMDPISVYSLSDRATKYGLLFIALSFVAVGLVEVLRRLRVHPIQYLLVGCALSVFFLLLVSLSEHLAFEWAYLVASAACTVLLGFYGSFVLRGWTAGLAFGAGIAALFGTLYVLLQREQTALMLGSLLLFGVLVVIMVATRRIDWYALMTQMREGGQPKDVTPRTT